MDGFDLIGDIHGHADALKALLRRLGYSSRGSRYGYRHPSRKAIFLGDFIDRGPGQREVVNIARSMWEDGAALAVMGNHELNALAFHTPDPERPGEHLRSRSDKNVAQHEAFLAEYPIGSTELADTLAWFYSLPLWLDLDELRVVHASWDSAAQERLATRLPPELTLTQSLLVEASREDGELFPAVESLLKGMEAELPAGLSYIDKVGHERRHARLRWWQPAAGQSWRSMALIPDREIAQRLPDTPLPEDLTTGYGRREPPVFFGHYWFDGEPAPVAANVACLDYSIARPGGKLVAYRWDGESTLDARKFVWVDG